MPPYCGRAGASGSLLWRRLPAGPKPSASHVYPHLHSFNTLDVSIDKQIYSDSDALDLYFSVQNVMNAQPDIDAPLTTATGRSYPVPPSENAMGRYFMVGVRGAL